MPRIHFVLVSMFLLVSALCAQASLVPNNGGNGVDGAFFAGPGTLTLNTSVQAVYQFTSFTVSAGATVNVIGANPLVIKAQGAVTIDGILSASGAPGTAGPNNGPGGLGGAGGPGGGAGGAGGASATSPFVGTGSPGLGASPGQPGIDSGVVGGPFTDPVGGGGGGGNATAGSNGGPRNAGGILASGAGGPAVAVCRAGSGGGGGGGDLDSATVASNNDGGGGGGGGGGDVVICSDASITINGTLSATGGAGGTSTGNGGAGGGGGSGGAIDVVAPFVIINGALLATGGAGGPATQTNCGCSPGGAGGDGCIRIATSSIAGGGPITPAALMTPLELLLTPGAPASGLAVTAQTATSNYIAVAAIGLAPVPIVLPAGTFFLDLSDPLLTLLFPVNTLPFVFGGLTGVAGGFVSIDTSLLILPPTFEITIFAQGASLTPGLVIDGITQLVPVRLRYLETPVSRLRSRRSR